MHSGGWPGTAERPFPFLLGHLKASLPPSDKKAKTIFSCLLVVSPVANLDIAPLRLCLSLLHHHSQSGAQRRRPRPASPHRQAQGQPLETFLHLRLKNSPTTYARPHLLNHHHLLTPSLAFTLEQAAHLVERTYPPCRSTRHRATTTTNLAGTTACKQPNLTTQWHVH